MDDAAVRAGALGKLAGSDKYWASYEALEALGECGRAGVQVLRGNATRRPIRSATSRTCHCKRLPTRRAKPAAHLGPEMVAILKGGGSLLEKSVSFAGNRLVE